MNPDISSFDLWGNAELAVSEDPLIRTTPRWTIAALASPAYYSRIISGNADIASSMTSGQQPAFHIQEALQYHIRSTRD